jgi:hypothetical protein
MKAKLRSGSSEEHGWRIPRRGMRKARRILRQKTIWILSNLARRYRAQPKVQSAASSEEGNSSRFALPVTKSAAGDLDDDLIYGGSRREAGLQIAPGARA